MICPNCKKEDTQGREMCPQCGHPVNPIPVPPGGKIHFGSYDWYVLDRQDDKALIITEKVIEVKAYHSRECEVTWETCDIRKYLNGEFYNSFGASLSAASDKERIIEVINENNDNPWYGTSGGNPTADRIFLLSIEEVVKYFGDSGQLKTKNRNPGWDWCRDEFLPWIDDRYNLARRAVDNTGKVSFWRLRSPGAKNDHVASVTGFCGDGFDQGGIDVGGCGTLSEDGHFTYPSGSGGLTRTDTYTPVNGVRPALWLKNL